MRYWIIAAALVLTLAATFGVYALKVGERAVPAPKAPAPASVLSSAKAVSSGGVVKVSGVVTAPDACMEASATTTPAEGGIRVDVTVPADDAPCLMLPTDLEWSASAEGTASSSVSVYLNGALATTTAAVPAPPPAKKK
jgi:hypothetical protein